MMFAAPVAKPRSVKQAPPLWQVAPAVPVHCRGPLTIGPVDDPLEREADRTAEAVLMRAPAGDPSLPGSTSASPLQISRLCDSCEGADEGSILAKGAGLGAARLKPPPSVHATLRSPGAPLDAGARAYFEPRFGRDFSGIRVHAGGQAARSATEIDARAYTAGRHIVFGAGRYQFGSVEGRRLLAHELAHVVQQSHGDTTLRRKPTGRRADATVVEPMDRAEALQVVADDLSRATDVTQAALMSLEATLRMPFTAGNAAVRVRRLSAAVSLLEAPEAGLVLDALHHPANARQKELRARFMRLGRETREPLLVMLDNRAQRTAEAAPKVEPVAPKPEPRRWSKLQDGVFAYIAPKGSTIDQVANHISGYEGLAEILSELNNVDRRTRLRKATPIVVPAEYVSRPQAIAEAPRALQVEIAQTQGHHARTTTYRRFVKVQSGHPAGPGAVGLAPVTLPRLDLPRLWADLKFFAGLVVGLFVGAYEAVKDLFVGAWEMINTISNTLENLITGNLGGIVKMVKGWIAQLKLLWANRAAIAADFMAKWEAKNDWDRGLFQGEVIGWVLMTVLITIVTWGQGALAQISGKWASVAKLLNVAQKAGELGTYASALAKAANKTLRAGIQALKASKLAKVVEVGAVVARPIAWTAKGLRTALSLPARMADELTDAIAGRLRVLEPYVEKIKNLSGRAKRWLFGCHSPCDWEPNFTLRQMDLDDGQIEARAMRDLGEEDWDVTELEGVGETPVRAQPRARGYAMEDRHIRTLEKEGYDRLPDWFKTHDAIRGGTVRYRMEKGRRIRVVHRPDAISIKSTWVTDPTRLTSTVEDYFEALRGRFGHTRGGVRVEGAASRTLELIFEEGVRLTPEALRVLDQLKASAGSIRFRWYVMQSDRIVPSAQYLRALRTVP